MRDQYVRHARFFRRYQSHAVQVLRVGILLARSLVSGNVPIEHSRESLVSYD